VRFQSAIRNWNSEIIDMAGFRMHVGTSSALGAGYAGALHTMYGVPLPTATVAGGLCGLAGMLPDLDSDFGVPLREAMSFAAATIPVFLVNRFESLQLTRETIIILAIGLYLFVRFGIGTMIRKFTVHRGMFHSIPAMLIFGGITFLLTSGFPTNERYMMAGGVMGGFFSHLLLDEIYAIEFRGGRWRTKKSFGTAMKLWGGDGWSNFSAYAKLAIVGMGVVGEPTMLKNFTTNTPQLAGQIGQAINLIAGMNKKQPELAKDLDQLRSILGTLNTNGTPQNGGAWPNATGAPQSGAPWQSVATGPPNNQYPYVGPTGSATIQPVPYTSFPPQELPPAAPINNQRADWQWPVANQSYTSDGQPAMFQNGYDTAQRRVTQYPE
jgi:hypothetical protein